MKTLLVINSSGRIARSITRKFTARFTDGWKTRQPDGEIRLRDVGTHAPPAIDEAWIAAAFTPAENRTPDMRRALTVSETLVDELICADAIVLGVPIYNFGMPGQLKTWCDQIVRLGRTFDFLPESADPYRPLLMSKPVAVIVSAGDGALHPGNPLAHLNFLEPHLKTVFEFIGLTDLTFVRVGYDEYKDERFQHSLADAEAELNLLQERWAEPMPPART